MPDSPHSHAVRTATEVAATGDDALTIDMVAQMAYCPRRFHLMYVEGRWADNEFTLDGAHVHRRVDALDHLLPDPDAPKNKSRDDGDEPPQIARSVPLASAALGLTGKLDLVALAGGEAVPVETKRRRVPDTPERSYETTRVQLMCQGLLLREHGHASGRGVVYYAASRTRVEVPFTDELEAATRELIGRARAAVSLTVLPEPLEDSPKCNGCSLSGICLPDETLALRDVRNEIAEEANGEPAEGPAEGLAEGPAGDEPRVRRLYPPRDAAVPLYVQEQGAFVGKTQGRLTVKKRGEPLGEARLKDVSQLVLCGNVGISAQTVHLLCEAGVPVVYLSAGNWFYGVTHGITLRNAYDRAAQFAAAADPARCLAFAKQIVLDKLANQRTVLRRNAPATREVGRALRDLNDAARAVPGASDLPSLLGQEGAGAAAYFRHFGALLKPRDFDATWDFATRNRRPPRDPVNALLSFAYALLAKECTAALLAEGLDPFWGLYHQPRHGRPSLALDLMEPLRPVVADSAVLTAINTGMVAAGDFERNADACVLRPGGRRGLIRAYEARLDQLVTHPAFGYRCSWRAVVRVQARLLARWLRGDVPRFQNVVTR